MKPSIKVNPPTAGHGVELQILIDGESVGRVELSAEELDSLIQVLANFRAKYESELPTVLHKQMYATAAIDPIWRVPTDHSSNRKLLAIRHPRFGWVLSLFSSQEATNLALDLTKINKQD